MDLAERLAVGGSDDAGKDLWLARDLPLNPGQHVHVAVQDEVVTALPEGMHVSVLVDGSSQATDDERGERGGPPGPYLGVPQVRASLGDINFEQAVHHWLVVGGADRLPHEAPALRGRDHLAFTLLLHRLLLVCPGYQDPYAAALSAPSTRRTRRHRSTRIRRWIRCSVAGKYALALSMG